MKKGTIIGVVSAKGGVGKTTITANLGIALASEFDKKVLVVDGNLTAPNLGLYLDIVRPPVTVHDVLSDQISISQSIYVHKTGLHVIPGSLSAGHMVDPENLGKAIAKVANRYDFVLVDSAPGLNEEVLAVVNASDKLLIVANPGFPTVVTTFKTVKFARDKRVPVMGVVLNRVRGKNEMGDREVAEALGLPVLSVIPEDGSVSKAVSRGMPVVHFSPKSSASVELYKLAATLAGSEYLAGFLSKTSKLLEYWRRIFFKEKGRTVWKTREVITPIEEEHVPLIKPPEEIEVPGMDLLDALDAKKKIYESALRRIRKNYEDGLLHDALYEELKYRYKRELERIEFEMESIIETLGT